MPGSRVGDARPVRRPRGIDVVGGRVVGEVALRPAAGRHGPDVAVAAALGHADEGDPVAPRRPSELALGGGIVGDPAHLRPVAAHDVDVRRAVPDGHEGDGPPVGRPGWVAVRVGVGQDGARPAARRHHGDLGRLTGRGAAREDDLPARGRELGLRLDRVRGGAGEVGDAARGGDEDVAEAAVLIGGEGHAAVRSGEGGVRRRGVGDHERRGSQRQRGENGEAPAQRGPVFGRVRHGATG